MAKNRVSFCAVLLLTWGLSALPASGLHAQTEQKIQSRVSQVLERMTLDEKLTLIEGSSDTETDRQYQAGYVAGIPRLGIPSLKLTDGPPGVMTKQASTGMTATMGLAATFSRSDAYANGVVIGQDARALGQDVVLEPFVNIDRDPTWARSFNTFGEDPLLSGLTGASEIKGIQSQGIMAQVKHYIAYDGPNNDYVDERTLHEIYLEPFADAVQAGVASVMSSYNRINGYYAANNAHNLIDILRNELGFKGWVDSDWGGNHGTTFFNAGLDMEMPGGNSFGFLHAFFTRSAMKEALHNGSIQESAIDHAVRHILYEYVRFGLLDGKSRHGISAEPAAADSQVVLQTAKDAATLLKNENQILPLGLDVLHSLALIGPGGGQTIATAGGGEKSPGIAPRQIGTYQALLQQAKDKAGIHISFATGIDMDGTPIPSPAFESGGGKGLMLHDLNSGESRRVDQINNTLIANAALPAKDTVTWKGSLLVPSGGTYWLNLQSLGATAVLFLDGKKLGCSGCGFIGSNPRYGIVHPGDNGVLPTKDGLNNKRIRLQLTSGKHALSLSAAADVSHQPVQVRLCWLTPQQASARFQQALAVARNAGTAVVFAYSRGGMQDSLPDQQDSLIEAIAQVNPRTIVVLNNSNPVPMPWLPRVKAVVDMWYPGDEGGYATADVLTGRVNPAGRLPFTWPARLDQGPANQPEQHPERTSAGIDSAGKPCSSLAQGPFAGSGCKTTYSEGIFVGYRYYDAHHETPLFPFGYGLSYTRFAYSHLRVTPGTHGGLDVQVDITNTGHRSGDEVPQVYLGAPATPPQHVSFAPKALAAYDRVTIPAGGTRSVSFHIAQRQLQYWSDAHGWVTALGKRVVYVGSSERAMHLSASVQIAH